MPYFRRNIGVVFQDFRLLPNKTVFQNVAFTLQVIGKSRGFIQEAVPDVLKMVGLDGKAQRLPHELSGGEQQRVAIARAVVNKPQVLLADEPTGNLDPATSAGIMAVLERINAGGTTVLMATHEAAIVDQMKRRVIELVNGQIVRDERHGGYGVHRGDPDHARASRTRRMRSTRTPAARVRAAAGRAYGPAAGADPSPQAPVSRRRRQSPPPGRAHRAGATRRRRVRSSRARAAAGSAQPRRSQQSRRRVPQPPTQRAPGSSRRPCRRRPRVAERAARPPQLHREPRPARPPRRQRPHGEQNVGPTK